jgi:cytochrome d ubiquinol oxidase subunit I
MGLRESVMNLAADAPPELLPAREQMAVSLGWHIILACFGVAFPAMIFVMQATSILLTCQAYRHRPTGWRATSAASSPAPSGTIR